MRLEDASFGSDAAHRLHDLEIEQDDRAPAVDPRVDCPIADACTANDPVEGVAVRGAVKWFDVVRGFGFLVDDAGRGDVLVHFSVLRDHGRRTLPEGAIVSCLASRRDRGLQASRILAIDLSSATGPDPDVLTRRAADRVDPAALLTQAGGLEPVIVKWFNRLKGYGFVMRHDDPGDIFVHMETVRRAGLAELLPEQRLMARVAEGRKGPLAVELVID